MSYSQAVSEAFKIYDVFGKATTWKKLLKRAKNSEVVFFGEYHDDPIIHFLQFRMLKELANENRNLALGLEMIEFQDAEVLRAYIEKELDIQAFLRQSQSLWPNYKTDYKHMVDFCRENNLHAFASNVPRQWASEVYKRGFEFLDTLDSDLKRLLPPLPIPYNPELPGYKTMLKMSHGHGGEHLPKAQALRDASMAWNVVQHIREGFKILHLNGTYHTNNYEGIIWYLNQYRPNTTFLTIAMVRQKDISRLQEEHKGLADFIIAVPEDMTRTH